MLLLNVVFQANKNSFILAFVLSVTINTVSWQLPFFWDTILTSTITQFFFENGFGNFITPADFDAGHPPLFYSYVTCFYHLFGKSLFSAHLSMLPFILISLCSFIVILYNLKFSPRQIQTGLLLLFCIPAVITQHLMVSYDVVLLSMYLLALAAFLNNQKTLFVLAAILMTGVSLRGLFCIASLSVTLFFLQQMNYRRWLSWNLLLLPAVFSSAGWYTFHYMQTGWMFSTDASGWSTQRGLADFSGIVKNGISILRILADYGVILLTLISLFQFIKIRKPDAGIFLWLVPVLIFSMAILPLSNPVNHRYFLIVYVLMIPGVLLFIQHRKRIYTVLVVLVLISGNLLIYPVPVSNGWDCTLAHISYFSQRKELMTKMEAYKLSSAQVGTVFPMNTSLYQTDMQLNTERLVNVNGLSVDSMPFILYSNIGNDFSDSQLIQIRTWKQRHVSRKGQVEMVLFENPKNNGH
jgi:hypothetical protein